MGLQSDKKLQELMRWLLEGMREYISDGGGPYSLEEVAQCERVLHYYLDEVSAATERASALECVKAAVTTLNVLNARCSSALIETDQREDLCPFFDRSGFLLGFFTEGEDVAGAWREW